MDSTPCVSVVMPVYNCQDHLPGAIESILNQTLTDFELIIVNDGSTDGSGEIAQSFSDGRIRYTENPTNLGLVASLNRSLDMARSDFIARMDGDDLSLPNRLSEQYHFLSQRPQIGAVGCAVQIIDENDRPVRNWRYPTDPSLTQWTMIFTNPMPHPGVMMRKRYVLAVGGYRPYTAEDMDLWERLSQVAQLTNLPTLLLKLRKHQTNITRQKKEALRLSAAEITQRFVRRSLGETITLDLATKLLGGDLDSPEEMLEVAGLIHRLFQGYVALPGISQSSSRRIRQDAARRVFKLLKQGGIQSRYGWKILQLAITLDPLVVARVMITRVSLSP